MRAEKGEPAEADSNRGPASGLGNWRRLGQTGSVGYHWDHAAIKRNQFATLCFSSGTFFQRKDVQNRWMEFWHDPGWVTCVLRSLMTSLGREHFSIVKPSLRTVRRTMIRFLIERLVRRT